MLEDVARAREWRNAYFEMSLATVPMGIFLSCSDWRTRWATVWNASLSFFKLS